MLPKTNLINKDELKEKVLNYLKRRIFEMIRTALTTFIIVYIISVTGCDTLSSIIPGMGTSAGNTESSEDATCLDIVQDWSEATLSLAKNNQRMLTDRLNEDDTQLDYERLYLETQADYNELVEKTSAEINSKDDEIAKLKVDTCEESLTVRRDPKFV